MQAASAAFAPPAPVRPQQAFVPTITQQPTPFTTFIGPGVPQVDYEFGTFKNEAGQTIQLKIKKGSKGELLPGEILPEGYTYVDPDATKTEEVTTTPTTGQTATVRPEDDNEPPISREETAIQRARVAAARKLGITDQVGFSMAGAFGKYGPEDVGKFTSTGFIIGKNGVLLDPLTGTARDESGGSPSILGTIISAISKNEEPPEPAYSDSFFDNMPDQAKDVLGRSLGKDARDARIAKAEELRQQTEARIAKAAEEARQKALEEKRDAEIAAAAARRDEQRRIREEKAAEIAAERQRIAEVQRRAREEMAARENERERQERIQRESRERQEDRDSGGSGQTAQERGDSYTADRVAEAVSTGDYSRGFVEGGLVAKPKRKAKKMKRGGLASKK